MQDNFNDDARDYLVLPLVAQQLKTAISGLHTVTKETGWVRAWMLSSVAQTRQCRCFIAYAISCVDPLRPGFACACAMFGHMQFAA